MNLSFGFSDPQRPPVSLYQPRYPPQYPSARYSNIPNLKPLVARSQVHKEIRKDFQHELSPTEFSASQYQLNSVLLIVPIKFSMSLRIHRLGYVLKFQHMITESNTMC